MKKVIHIFTSDEHFGDGSGSDDSLGFESRYIRFLEYLRSMCANVIHWHLGDWWELDQSVLPKSLFKIPWGHRAIFRLERTLYKVRFMPGNHDNELTFLGPAAFWESTSKFRVLPFEGLRVLLHHGHDWDPFCRDDSRIGGSVSWLIGLGEKAGWKDMDHDLGKLRRHSIEEHDKAAVAAAIEYNCKVVIKGHTHHAHMATYGTEKDNVMVFDTGSPIGSDRIPYVKISDNQIELLEY